MSINQLLLVLPALLLRLSLPIDFHLNNYVVVSQTVGKQRDSLQSSKVFLTDENKDVTLTFFELTLMAIHL